MRMSTPSMAPAVPEVLDIEVVLPLLLQLAVQGLVRARERGQKRLQAAEQRGGGSRRRDGGLAGSLLLSNAQLALCECKQGWGSVKLHVACER